MDGLRRSKESGGVSVEYVWDGANIVADTSGGAVLASYIRGFNLLRENTSAGQRYYQYNGHGDVTGLADSSAALDWRYDYDAFGNEKEIAGQYPALDTNPFRYSGEYYDSSSGTYYLRARHYFDAKTDAGRENRLKWMIERLNQNLKPM